MAGSSKKLSGQLVVDCIKANPNLPTRQIARIVYDQNNLLFTDLEHARAVVRYYRGASGVRSRGLLGTIIEDNINVPDDNPLGLPESDEEEYEYLPYHLSKDCRKVLWLSDVHMPYHNIQALTVAIQKGITDQVDTIFLGGDILDCYTLSRWEKDPKRRKFHEELEMCRQFLTRLRELFPNARIYYKLGNHEERYQIFLRQKAPELQLIDDFRLDVLLRFGENRIEGIDDKRTVHLGKLRMLHGHEFGKSVFSPVNPARGYYMRSKKSMIAGHNHQTSEHTEPNLDGDIETTWSTGCLCELHPEYMPLNKWNHGFARIDIDEHGDYSVNNYRIYNGRIL